MGEIGICFTDWQFDGEHSAAHTNHLVRSSADKSE